MLASQRIKLKKSADRLFQQWNGNSTTTRNINIAYASSFLSGLLFFLPVWALYLQKSLFTIENVAIIISVQAIATVLFEFPTGAVGDLFGRKKTILLGKLITFFSVIFLYIGGNIWLFVIYAVLASLGSALVSGTDGALIYDLDVLLVALLQEPKYEKEKHRDIFRQMRDVSGEIIKNRQLVLLLVFSLMAYGIGESLYSLYPLFFSFKEIRLEYFGYVFAAMFALSSIGHYFSHEVSERLGNRNTILLTVVGTVFLILLATMAVGLAAAFFIVLGSLLFGLRNPIIGYLINLETESKKRATVLSAYSMAWQLGKFACAPMIGYLADLYTINTAFALSALMMVFTMIPALFIKE
ncbi:MAG: MFS transporter [Candidatus Micrarchaeota archaeon]|nr:MFS transporter [Candidatus Micrarchaeota archaeon]